MKKAILTSITFAFLGVAAVAVPAQQTTQPAPADNNQAQWQSADKMRRFGRKFGPKRFGRHHGRGFFGVNLSEEQKAQIRVIMQANQPDPGTIEQMKTLIAAKRNGTITPEQLEQLKQFRSVRKEKRQYIHQQIEAILTPEQKALIQQRKEAIQKRMQERKELWLKKKSQKSGVEQKPMENQ